MAAEFNKMVDRLIEEKNKTEAIIASLEDGVVVVDPNGVVSHINEVAALILARKTARLWAVRLTILAADIPTICVCGKRCKPLQKIQLDRRASSWIFTCAGVITPTC